mgnify:CR=1 FL=1
MLCNYCLIPFRLTTMLISSPTRSLHEVHAAAAFDSKVGFTTAAISPSIPLPSPPFLISSVSGLVTPCNA